MTDLVERLRHWAEHYHNADLDEAADEIERLTAELQYQADAAIKFMFKTERLRAVLTGIAEMCENEKTNLDVVCEVAAQQPAKHYRTKTMTLTKRFFRRSDD